MGARILAVVDALDAMTSDRPYREPPTGAQARTELQRCAGRQFDHQVAHAFLRIVDEQSQPMRSVHKHLSVLPTPLSKLASLRQSGPRLPFGKRNRSPLTIADTQREINVMCQIPVRDR